MKLDISSSGSRLLISEGDGDKPNWEQRGATIWSRPRQGLSQLPAHSHQLQIPAGTNPTSSKGQQLYTSYFSRGLKEIWDRRCKFRY